MDSASISTPPFLLWAIEYSCPVRGFQNGSDPDHTERQLRAAMALSAARREGRVFEGYCIEEPLGFCIDEALAIYGGLELVERTCGACPANALTRIWPGELAGCLRMFILPNEEEKFCQRVDEVIEQAGLADEYARLFHSTRSRWHGFWISSPLSLDQVKFLVDLFGVNEMEGGFGDQLAELHAGLCAARDNQLPIHASLYPRGSVEGNWWRLAPHCPRCKGGWQESGRGRCNVCGYEGHPAQAKKRRARGRRPYLPLERLMGEQEAEQFLMRYQARARGI
jgi:hypothetical protein